ncbi:MAG: RNA polymerase sigma factor [Planctomycetota bacterium]|nr:RNA polymerase sigma factor [Planctomycetota bacterium]
MDHQLELATIRRAKSGDVSAFTDLIEAHQQRLYRFLLRICGRPELAEDIVQDAFVRVLRNIDRFDERYRFSTWLFTIGRRLLINSLQKNRPRSESDWIESSESDSFEGVVDGSSREERLATAEILDDALDVLTPQQREVVVLYHHKDHSVHEISSLIGIPPGTVKSHLHRARRRMRDWISSNEQFLKRIDEFMGAVA